MNCKELIYLLEDYLDSTMEPQLKEELDVHLSMCETCLHFLETYDRTRILCRQITLEEIPLEFRERLRSFVLEKAREKREGIEKYLRKETKDRHDRAVTVTNGYLERQLSPRLSREIERHRRECRYCGGYFRTLDRSGNNPEIGREVEEHLSAMLDEMPVGEPPFRS